MTNSMDAVSAKIRNTHATVQDRLAASGEQLGEVSLCYNDILADLQTLRGQLAKIGCPRSEDLVKKLIVSCEGIKAIMEEELAKPR